MNAATIEFRKRKREQQARYRQQHGDARRAYNREWMRAYRAKKGAK